MASPIFGVGLINAIIFGVYGNTMRYIKKWRDERESKYKIYETDFDHFLDVTVAGSIAGFLNSYVIL